MNYFYVMISLAIGILIVAFLFCRTSQNEGLEVSPSSPSITLPATSNNNRAPWIVNKTPIPLSADVDPNEKDELEKSVDPGAHIECREQCNNDKDSGIDFVTCMNICLQRKWQQPSREKKFLKNFMGIL